MARRHKWSKRQTCQHSGEVAAYLTGELDATERSEFEAHAARCCQCRREVEVLRRVVDVLKSLAPVKAGRDLVPELLAKLGEEDAKARRAAWTWTWAAAAAVLMIGSGILLAKMAPGAARRAEQSGMVSTTRAPLEASRIRAVAWLCQAQDATGAWDVAKWGGDKRYSVALTGLALLAILDEQPFAAEQEAAAQKAVDFLMAEQNPTGEFGPQFSGSAYNQGIATLALLRAMQVLKVEKVRAAAEKAIEVICARQTPAGGWGYWAGAPEEPNLAVSFWQVEALKLAEVLGWHEVRPRVRAALAWMAEQSDDQGLFSYSRSGEYDEASARLTAMGAMALFDVSEKLLLPKRRALIMEKVMQAADDWFKAPDYWSAYFLTGAMRKMADEKSLHCLEAIRQALIGIQVRSGAEAGSWAPTDRWSDIGGRTYATAVASLTLR